MPNLLKNAFKKLTPERIEEIIEKQKFKLVERYRVSYEWSHKNDYFEHQETFKYRQSSGFRNKANALKKYKDIKENPNNYMGGSGNKMLSVRFITIITEEILF